MLRLISGVFLCRRTVRPTGKHTAVPLAATFNDVSVYSAVHKHCPPAVFLIAAAVTGPFSAEVMLVITELTQPSVAACV
jgi:hypothetical protein